MRFLKRLFLLCLLLALAAGGLLLWFATTPLPLRSSPLHFTIEPGKTAKASGSMLASVVVRFELDATVGGTSFAKGDTMQLKPGRTNVVVDGQSLWVDIPRVSCRLRKDGSRLVCDP